MPTFLHRSDTLVVVDKPTDWLVHPAGTDVPDLLAWLAAQGAHGLAPIHRLDRGTSGPVLFAPRSDVESWSRAFRDKAVQKTYHALVYGLTRSSGTLTRSLKDARRGAPLSAETRYTTEESFGKWSLLRVTPITGRKHQIRRHLEGIGHPLIGDERYRGRGRKTVPAYPGRLWLHCSRLELPDGRAFESPLPAALEAHLAVLRQR